MTRARGVEVRDVPERHLACVRAEVYQREVSAFLGKAFTQLFDLTNARPGARSPHTTAESPTYAIYYGIFGFDAPTPVEACVVLDDDAVIDLGDLDEGIYLRTDPPHREAFLPVTRRMLNLPAISAAYDRLGEWVASQGRMVKDLPPREVYIADVMTAGADDHVCDVAFPFEPR